MLAGLLFGGMGAGTFTIVSLGIMASFIIADLGITRAELGLVIGVDTLFAAAVSPFAGRAADRLGGRRALVALFLLAALAWTVYGLAAVYALMFVGALFGGIADASCNPATNLVIAEAIPPGRRGVITGIKQSGVQAGIFLGGITLPSLAVAFGWRPTYFITTSVPLVAAVLAWRLVPETRFETTARHRGPSEPMPASIRWLAAYGVLFGFAGAVVLLIPLYVEEALGLDARIGGIAAGAIGLVAVGGRIWWARLAERTSRFVESLWAMTPLGVLGGLAFLFAESTTTWLIWLGALLLGMSTSSWNSVGMLAVMNEAGPRATGRASGIVVSGFLVGFGLGPPIFGAAVDATDTYTPMWIASIAAAAAAGLLVAVWRRSRRLAVSSA